MKIKYFLLTVLFTVNIYALGITGEKAPSFGVDTWVQNNNSKKLDISDFVETFPLSQINSVFAGTLEHKYDKRSILVPDFN